MSYPIKPDAKPRFTARTKRLLRSVAHQPWQVCHNGLRMEAA